MDAEPIRLLLAANDSDVYHTLNDLILRGSTGMVLLRWSQDIEEVRRAVENAECTVCLVSASYNDGAGREPFYRSLAAHKDTPVILCSDAEDYELDIESMRAGVMDFFVLHQTSPAQLERIIRHAIARKRIELEITVSQEISRRAEEKAAHLSAIVEGADRTIKDAEARIEGQIHRIQALRNIDMAITGSVDLRVTMNVILDQVTTHLRVDSAAVHLFNSHTQRLEYSTGRGFRTSGLQRTNIRLGEDCAGRAALERKVLTIPDLNNDNGEFVRGPMIANEGFVSYWAAPLVTKGRVEGVLELYHRSALHGDDDWFNFLETLAGQAAIAIENAALFTGLQRTNLELQIAYDSTLEGWSKALDLKDKETEGHTLRVTESTTTLARSMNIAGDDQIQIRRGALLHDIGKMGIPDSILLKPGPLTPKEWEIMRRHPVYAYELLAPIPFLRAALDIPYCHHEKWDGSGYPRGLKGEQIPLSARIFAVIDVRDALKSKRPYRASWHEAKVRKYIVDNSGTHFDPDVVEAFLAAEL